MGKCTATVQTASVKFYIRTIMTIVLGCLFWLYVDVHLGMTSIDIQIKVNEKFVDGSLVFNKAYPDTKFYVYEFYV